MLVKSKNVYIWLIGWMMDDRRHLVVLREVNSLWWLVTSDNGNWQWLIIIYFATVRVWSCQSSLNLIIRLLKKLNHGCLQSTLGVNSQNTHNTWVATVNQQSHPWIKITPVGYIKPGFRCLALRAPPWYHCWAPSCNMVLWRLKINTVPCWGSVFLCLFEEVICLRAYIKTKTHTLV